VTSPISSPFSVLPRASSFPPFFIQNASLQCQLAGLFSLSWSRSKFRETAEYNVFFCPFFSRPFVTHHCAVVTQTRVLFSPSPFIPEPEPTATSPFFLFLYLCPHTLVFSFLRYMNSRSSPKVHTLSFWKNKVP